MLWRMMPWGRGGGEGDMYLVNNLNGKERFKGWHSLPFPLVGDFVSSIQVRGVQATFEEENCWSGTGSLAGSHWVDATTGGPAWGRSLDSPGELTGAPSTPALSPGNLGCRRPGAPPVRSPAFIPPSFRAVVPPGSHFHFGPRMAAGRGVVRVPACCQ